MKKISSKKQVALIMMVFFVPLVGLLLCYGVYSIHTLNDRVALSGESALQLYRETVKRDLSETDYFLSNFLANDRDCAQLRYPVGSLKAHVLGVEVVRKLQSQVNVRPYLAGILFCSRKNSLHRAAYYSRSYAYAEKASLEALFTDAIENHPDCHTWGWFLREVEGRPFLLRILGNQETYSMCAVDLDYVDFSGVGEQEDAFFFFADSQGIPLTEKPRLAKKHIEAAPVEEAYSISPNTGGPESRSLLVGSGLGYGGLHLIYAMPYSGLLMNMDQIQIAILTALAVILLLVFFSFWLLLRYWLHPLESLVGAMEQVGSGNLDVQLGTSYPTDEFVRLAKTFNHMTRQIQAFKIASYEQELEIQRAQIQYLKVQIRPHFFLNCLKNIYGLAQGKEFDKIQDMVLRLSEYLRFLLYDDRTLAPLSAEVRNVRNYIGLQAMCMPEPPRWTMELDPQLEQTPAPPFALLAFVENAMKYGAAPGRTLELTIRGSLLEGGGRTYAVLTVRDNGRGFPEEALAQLNAGGLREGGHIGIQNVCRRFRLLYGEDCEFLFSNRGGAQVEIYFPCQLPEEDQEGGREP